MGKCPKESIMCANINVINSVENIIALGKNMDVFNGIKNLTMRVHINGRFSIIGECPRDNREEGVDLLAFHLVEGRWEMQYLGTAVEN
jgi:hypothetical protein